MILRGSQVGTGEPWQTDKTNLGYPGPRKKLADAVGAGGKS